MLKWVVRISKTVVKPFVPAKWQREYQLWREVLSNYFYDLRKFVKWSATCTKKYDKEQLQALITKEYHRIEKALALRECRVGFGKDVTHSLINIIEEFIVRFGVDQNCRIAVNVLGAYRHFNFSHGYEDKTLSRRIEALREKVSLGYLQFEPGGVDVVTREEIWASAKRDLRDFFLSRHSIRDFSEEDIDVDLILQAIAMAQQTPSVCNRQASKVYVFSSTEDKAKVLELQNGNRGFDKQINKVLIVTSNLQGFLNVGERNQCWIDGGMFAMSLVYALHSLGLGTCCLNWSVTKETDVALHRAAAIPEHEVVLMMIAVGHLPKRLRVAQSSRKPLLEVAEIK